MKLDNITLEHWLEAPPADKFRNGKIINYYHSYMVIKKYLIDNVYKDVASAANLKEKEEGMYYNDHGIGHVDTVIDRASELVKSEYCDLNAKEVYFLLCAILIHDIGNIFGRTGHEARHHEVISHIMNDFSNDTAEQTIIIEIAKAHGGRTSRDSKDTISELLTEKHYGHEKVRTRLISSILRFADEIADDRTRASHAMLNNNQLVESPSEIFHAYSACLDSVIVKHHDNAIFIQYHIPIGFIQRKFKKLKSDSFLVDEIYERIEKMHLENIYCQKYISKFIPLSRIEVNIEFMTSYKNPFDSASSTPPPIKFSIENKGYPESPSQGIFELCPNLSEGAIKLDGDYYFKKFHIIPQNEQKQSL